MDNVHALQSNCKITLWPWKPNKILFSKTLITKPKTQSFSVLCLHQSASAEAHANIIPKDQENDSRHVTLVVERYHQHRMLRALLDKLKKNGSSPCQLLQHDGDWCKDRFWAVIKYLRNSSRSKEILQVFNMWKDIEKSRNNEYNYEKIIGMLGEEGLMEDAATAFTEMKSFGLIPSLKIYNSMVHVYAKNGEFNDALFYLNQMKENNLPPESDTYDGLIVAYGKYKMYDEMGMCLKKMKLDGCSPDDVTYNLLVQRFAQGGLVSRMERVYQSLRTRRMGVQCSTLIAMLEAYANLGIVEKMERALRWVWYSKTNLKEDLIRKIARVYVENYMFSRLDVLGDEIASRTGATDIVWCLRLLSHACVLSRKGMDSVVREMEEAEVPWNVTVANIILLAYLKMKDFTHLRMLCSRLTDHCVKPDIVTVGILFDAIDMGFDGTRTLETWKRIRLLHKGAEMETDPLVLTAFGKGQFHRNCEVMYSSLGPKAKEKKRWTYYDLIRLLAKHSGRQPQVEKV